MNNDNYNKTGRINAATFIGLREGQFCRMALCAAVAYLTANGPALRAQPATLQLSPTNGTNVVLQWNTGGTLQFAPSVFGPWTTSTELASVVSSSTAAANGPTRFFRVVDNGLAGTPVPLLGNSLPQALNVQGASVQLLALPVLAGNSRLEVTVSPGQLSSSNRVALLVGDTLTQLRDDGLFPDRVANDGIFSAVVNVDTNDLNSLNSAISNLIPSRRFTKIFDRRAVLGTNSLQAFPTTNFFAGSAIVFFTNNPFGNLPQPCAGSPLAYDWRKTILINDLSVVQDATRTWDPCPSPNGTGTKIGAWTFGKLMTDMANTVTTGIDPSDFVLNWLRSWQFVQTINSDTIAAVPNIKSLIVDPWLASSAANGFPPNKLDLSIAPFRLLAIVNRVDLRANTTYGGVSQNTAVPPCLGGEARFVFCACDANCNPLQLTVILEYCVPKNTCQELRSWGQQWAALDSMSFSPAFNNALQAITDQFATANADPSRLPNRSAINQVRANEILGSQWVLREWRIADSGVDAGLLREVAVKQTPASAQQNTANLHSFITANNGTLCSGSLTIPVLFGGNPFLGGSAPMQTASFFWNAPGLVSAEFCARHQLSLNACNGCHAGETTTGFKHVEPRSQNFPAALSNFLLGETVADPVDPLTTYTFADLDRRVQNLNQLVICPCPFQVPFFPLLMVH